MLSAVFELFEQQNPVIQALLATLFTWFVMAVGAILLSGSLVVTDIARWIHDDCSDVFYSLSAYSFAIRRILLMFEKLKKRYYLMILVKLYYVYKHQRLIPAHCYAARPSPNVESRWHEPDTKYTSKQSKLCRSEPVRGKVVKKLKSLGFNYVTIDLEGFRSGSLNETLSEEEKAENI